MNNLFLKRLKEFSEAKLHKYHVEKHIQLVSLIIFASTLGEMDSMED